MKHWQQHHDTRRSALLTFLVGTLLTAGPAAALVSVFGVVTERGSGRPLAAVSVVLIGLDAHPDSTFRRGTLSNAAGRYAIEAVPLGRHLVRLSHSGYETVSDTLVVVGDDMVRFDAELRGETETIVVEGSRRGRARSTQPAVVDLQIDQLENVPAIGETDPIRSLQLLPGVQAASDISSGLYIRGGGPDQTLILLDDVTVYNPTHAFGFFSTFNADAIDGVTLYKGAYPAEHGGRLGAVVDVDSRTPRASQITGRASVSTISARLALEGPLGGNRWLVNGRRTYLEPILSALRKSTPEIPYYSFYDLNAKFVTARDGDWSEFLAYRGRDDLRVEPDPNARVEIDWGNTLVAATYNRGLADDVFGKLTLSFSEYESITDADIFNTPFEINNRLRDLSAHLAVDWQRGRHVAAVGVQASLFDFRFDQSFNRDDPIGFSTQPLETSVYLDDQWTYAAGGQLRSGLRARYITDGQRLLLEPRLSWSQALTRTMRVKVGGGVYNQYLQLVTTEGFSAADVYVPVDDTATPGRSVQGVVGLEWSPSRTWQLSIEGYYTDLENLLAPDGNTPADQESFNAENLFFTGGTGYASGLEVFAQRRLGLLTGWIGYTLGWTRRTFDELNGGRPFAPKYDRRHDMSAVVSYQSGPWSYSAAFVAATGQAFTPASARYRVSDPALGEASNGVAVLPARRNSARLLPYHRFDVSVKRAFAAFGKPASVYLQVFNLYSRRNEWFVQFANDKPDADVFKMLPIVPSLGVSFSF